MQYKEIYFREIKNLIAYLRSERIDEDTIDKMVESGFILNSDLITDTFYGQNIAYQPSISIDDIRYFQANGKWNEKTTLHYTVNKVNDVGELYEILDSLKKQYKHILYRGSTNHFIFKRKFQSPFYSDKDGYEISLIPSFYRKFSKDYMTREGNGGGVLPAFNSTILRELYNVEIKRLLELYTKNQICFDEFYNKMDDYREIMWQNNISELDLHTIEQHYGLDSNVLDVTFNVDTALFFAFNKLVNIKQNYFDYSIIDKNEYKNAVLYILVPQSTLEDINEWKYTEIKIMDTECVRPVRQECTSLPVDVDAINRAASEVVSVIRFSDDFVLPDNVPKKDYLFPSSKDDPFYKYLLKNEQIKEKVMQFVFHL